MSAAQAIALREREAFSANLLGLLRERGLTRSEFCKKVYGVNTKGAPKGSGCFSQVMTGKQRATAPTLQRYANALGVPLQTVVDLRNATQPAEAEPRSLKKTCMAVKSPMDTAIQKGVVQPDMLVARQSAGQIAHELGDRDDQFSLVVGQDGRATLRLNLKNIPLEKAMRVMHALTGSGLLTDGSET